jgi:hypothetical protein
MQLSMQMVRYDHLIYLQPFFYVYFTCAAISILRHSKPAAVGGSVFYVYQPHVGAQALSSLVDRAPRAAVVGLTTTAPQHPSAIKQAWQALGSATHVEPMKCCETCFA